MTTLTPIQENTASSMVSYLSGGTDHFHSAFVEGDKVTIYTVMGNALDVPYSAVQNLEAAEDYLFKPF